MPKFIQHYTNIVHAFLSLVTFALLCVARVALSEPVPPVWSYFALPLTVILSFIMGWLAADYSINRGDWRYIRLLTLIGLVGAFGGSLLILMNGQLYVFLAALPFLVWGLFLFFLKKWLYRETSP